MKSHWDSKHLIENAHFILVFDDEYIHLISLYSGWTKKFLVFETPFLFTVYIFWQNISVLKNLCTLSMVI